MVTDDYRNAVDGDQYKICMNEDCDVIYYNLDKEIKFLKDQVRVPIWFKKDADPKYACYCSKVTEDQVIEAVVKHGAKTVKEVNAITGAMKNSLCKENNPLGVCCHKIIQEAIDKGLTMKCLSWYVLTNRQNLDIFPQTRANVGYVPTTSVDMFPLTIGVEAITLLERTN